MNKRKLIIVIALISILTSLSGCASYFEYWQEQDRLEQERLAQEREAKTLKLIDEKGALVRVYPETSETFNSKFLEVESEILTYINVWCNGNMECYNSYANGITSLDISYKNELQKIYMKHFPSGKQTITRIVYVTREVDTFFGPKLVTTERQVEEKDYAGIERYNFEYMEYTKQALILLWDIKVSLKKGDPSNVYNMKLMSLNQYLITGRR